MDATKAPAATNMAASTVHAGEIIKGANQALPATGGCCWNCAPAAAVGNIAITRVAEAVAADATVVSGAAVTGAVCTATAGGATRVMRAGLADTAHAADADQAVPATGAIR